MKAFDAEDAWFKVPKDASFGVRVMMCRRRYSYAVARWPAALCAVQFVVMIIFLAIAFIPGALDTGEGNASSPGQFLAVDDILVRREFALGAMREEEQAKSGKELPFSEPAHSLLTTWSVPEGKNVWTRQSMLDIFDSYEALQGRKTIDGAKIDGFEDYCWRQYNSFGNESSCQAPITPIHYMLFPSITFGGGRVERSDVEALSDQDVREKAVESLHYAKNPKTAPAGLPVSTFLSFFAKDITDNYHVNMTADDMVSEITLGTLFFGGPIDVTDNGKQEYDNAADQPVEQRQLLAEWGAEQYIALFDAINAADLSVEAHWWNNALGNLAIINYIQGDLLLTAVAASVIVVIIGVQSGTIVMAILSVLFLAWTYPAALVIYHGIFRIQISPQLNQLTLFTLLGIGADNAFILLGSYFQSYAEPASAVGTHAEAYKRTDYVLRRTISSTFIANLTTTVAFALTALSPIPSISAFGSLAAASVIVLFVGTQTFLLASLELWHRAWHSHMRCCGSVKRDPREYFGYKCSCGEEGSPFTSTAGSAAGSGGSSSAAAGATASPLESSAAHASGAKSTTGAAPPAALRRIASDHLEELDMSQYRPLERFYYSTWAPFIKTTAWMWVGVLVVALGLGIFGSSYLEPPDNEPSGLPTGSMLQVLVDEKLPLFAPAALSNTGVFLVWGVDRDDPVDRSGIDRNDEERQGSPIFQSVSDFPIHTWPALQEVIAACDKAQSARFDSAYKNPSHDPSMTLVDSDAGGLPVACAPREYLSWEATQQGFNYSDWNATGWANTGYATPTAFRDRIITYQAELRASPDPTDILLASSWVGTSRTDVDRVLALVIRANSTLPVQAERSALGRHTHAWLDLMDEINKDNSVVTGYATSWFFAFFRTTELMVATTINSIGITYGVAVAVVLVVSMNWQISLITAINLAAVVLSIIAVLVAMGVKLGLTEAIILALLPGLSVDAPIHISEAYSLSHANGRFVRIRFALLELGVSVLGGAVTSIVPNVILLGASLPFFISFGRTIAVTIAIAFFFANTCLPASFVLFGPPTSKDGSIPLLVHSLLYKDGADTKQDAKQGGDKGRAAPVHTPATA